MRLILWRLAALMFAALSLGPSFAHLLEAAPRLTRWPPELWREATVFGGQYEFFGLVGGPLDIGAVLVLSVAAYLDRGPAFRFALAGALLFAISLACWFSIVAPANAVLATWTPGPLPEEFHAVRNRWEGGHIIMAILKFLGFMAVAVSALLPSVSPSPSSAAPSLK